MDVIKNDNCDTPNCNRDLTNTTYGDIIAKKNGCKLVTSAQLQATMIGLKGPYLAQ